MHRFNRSLYTRVLFYPTRDENNTRHTMVLCICGSHSIHCIRLPQSIITEFISIRIWEWVSYTAWECSITNSTLNWNWTELHFQMGWLGILYLHIFMVCLTPCHFCCGVCDLLNCVWLWLYFAGNKWTRWLRLRWWLLCLLDLAVPRWQFETWLRLFQWPIIFSFVFLFQLQALMVNLFKLFDVDNYGYLVQDKWIEHLKGRLTWVQATASRSNEAKNDETESRFDSNLHLPSHRDYLTEIKTNWFHFIGHKYASLYLSVLFQIHVRFYAILITSLFDERSFDLQLILLISINILFVEVKKKWILLNN